MVFLVNSFIVVIKLFKMVEVECILVCGEMVFIL